MTFTELCPCYDARQSFYGKAHLIIDGNIIKLQSYETIVCEYNTKSGEFRKLWGGWSNTTGRHITEFCKQYGISNGGKKWWDSLKVVA